jgi:hypothetical protein
MEPQCRGWAVPNDLKESGRLATNGLDTGRDAPAPFALDTGRDAPTPFNLNTGRDAPAPFNLDTGRDAPAPFKMQARWRIYLLPTLSLTLCLIPSNF